MPKSESDAELNAEESEPSSEEVTDRNLDSEPETETPQDLETVTEHKTIIGEDPQLAATSERRQDSKPVTTNDLSEFEITPGPEKNKLKPEFNFEDGSGSILNLQDQHYDLLKLSENEMLDLGEKIGVLSKQGDISIDYKDETLILEISKNNGPYSALDSEKKALSKQQLSEFNGLNDVELKRAYHLYIKVALLIRSKVYRIENKQLVPDFRLMFQRNLLHPHALISQIKKN